ncbi:MAG: CoA-acylating methylmalonate-semialdehyde dehydrogenase [Chloroflexi bacterium]|nr:CoA-acylating methylmalonate-semialdehyde dehydrogenase [Chloroflexota bacterium]
MSPALRTLKNYIKGEWVTSKSEVILDVMNPATDEPIARVPISTVAEANEAVEAAYEAFWGWRSTPPISRAQYMFRLKEALEDSFDQIAELVTMENGKTLAEAQGEVRRTIENVEVACGIPSLMQGYNAEDIAEGIDSIALRQPLGVFVHLAPFNFPAMVPYWFAPYAIATGNTFVVKPSPQTPLTQGFITELVDRIGLPKGVLNLVNGASEVAEALMAHPRVKGVTFVGSTPVGKHVYSYSASHGKRVLVQAGAKNFLVVMPDADLERTVEVIMTSAYGCAGQRCLAGSVVLAVGGVSEELGKRMVEAASGLRVGYGLHQATQMGPVISRQAKERILGYIEQGIQGGANLLLDGRGIQVPDFPHGYFVGPTLFGEVTPDMTIAREEIFGPVLGIMQVESLAECYRIIAGSPFGNAASIFTQSGKLAREFAYRVECGNIGVNIGIAAPVAFFPFGGMRDSFFGVLHGQGQDAIRFFTDDKIMTIRWF